MNYSISQIITSDKKEDNRNSINSLDLEKFNIKKIKYKKVENKKIIDFLFKKALMESYETKYNYKADTFSNL